MSVRLAGSLSGDSVDSTLSDDLDLANNVSDMIGEPERRRCRQQTAEPDPPRVNGLWLKVFLNHSMLKCPVGDRALMIGIRPKPGTIPVWKPQDDFPAGLDNPGQFFESGQPIREMFNDIVHERRGKVVGRQIPLR